MYYTSELSAQDHLNRSSHWPWPYLRVNPYRHPAIIVENAPLAAGTGSVNTCFTTSVVALSKAMQ